MVGFVRNHYINANSACGRTTAHALPPAHRGSALFGRITVSMVGTESRPGRAAVAESKIEVTRDPPIALDRAAQAAGAASAPYWVHNEERHPLAGQEIMELHG